MHRTLPAPRVHPAHRNPDEGRVRYNPQVRRQRASLRRPRKRRSRVLLGFLIAVGFVLSGVIGVVAYFMPAIVTAFEATGHTIARSPQTAQPSAGASGSGSGGNRASARPA